MAFLEPGIFQPSFTLSDWLLLELGLAFAITLRKSNSRPSRVFAHFSENKITAEGWLRT